MPKYPKPTKDEALKDLADTERDILYLINAVNALELFQANAQDGDDRMFVKPNIMRYRTLLDEARDLRTKIQEFIQ